MMRVRCGRCSTEVEIPGPGSFVCPVCGTQNQVRPKDQADPQNQELAGVERPLPVETNPAPRVTCGSCSFTFAVGDIEVAICPNCRAEVKVETEDPA